MISRLNCLGVREVPGSNPVWALKTFMQIFRVIYTNNVVIPRQNKYLLPWSSHEFPLNLKKKIVPYLSDFLAKGKCFKYIFE